MKQLRQFSPSIITVRFTSDYTVATWVGNCDGHPIRQVSLESHFTTFT